MDRRVLIGLVLVVLVSIAALWASSSYWMPPSETGFKVVSLQDNTVLLSDADVLFYNWTNQEMALTDGASQRLLQMGDNLYLYSPGFAIRINGEEMYKGIFREASMSALPPLPQIAVLFPSVSYPSDTIDVHALRMFYPFFEPPGNQSETDSKLAQYFEQQNKLIH